MNSDIKINLADNSDKLQLLTFFQHYHQPQLSSKRVDCFLHHNFTVVAKDKDKIIANYFKSHHLQLRRIYLFVSQTNLPARALYEKIGFKKITSLGNLFADDQTEFFYCLDLN